MPHGKGTYGSKVGRPRKKYNQGTFDYNPNIEKDSLLLEELVKNQKERLINEGLKPEILEETARSLAERDLKGIKAGEAEKKYNKELERKEEIRKANIETYYNLRNLGINEEEISIIKNNTIDSKPVRAIINRTEKEMNVEPGNLYTLINSIAKQEITPKFNRSSRAEGGPMSMDDQMQMAMGIEEQQLPDEEMEDNYLDFIIDEALSEEEEEMLMSKLEQDEQLSMLFDKVLEVASEFAGSGPVDGPGSGVSDSIPARLSDGEFVFTAKATEEIGADELMRMMKDAEAQADGRQELAIGGIPLSEEEKILEEVETSDSKRVARKISDNMMDPYTQDRYVRS
jgi:hypothetical protein